MSDQTNVISTTKINAHRIRKGLVTILLVAFVALLGVFVWRTSPQAPSAPIATNSQLPLGASRNGIATQMPVDIVSTTLGSNGFTPTKINHAAGSFRLKVNNQSKQAEIVLRLSNASGEKLSEVTVTNKVHAWVGNFELGPGAYTLSEAGHSKWTCQITIAGSKRVE